MGNDFNSQDEAILQDLMKGQRITGFEAWIRYGSAALHSRISTLRNKKGVPVQSVRIRVTKANGKLASVCQYFLDPTYIEQAKTARA